MRRRFGSARTAQAQPRITATESLLAPIPPMQPAHPPGPKIVLLNDCRDQENYGAQALIDGLLRIMQRAVPAATITPIPSHFLIDAVPGFGAFVNGGEGLRQPKVRYPTVADQFDDIADEWIAGRAGPDSAEILSRFDDANLVVLNGEGSIYRTNLSAVRELFLAWLAKERLGIPTVYINGGLHLTGVIPVLPAMVRKTFSRLDAVAVREPCSLRNLREYVPNVEARLFPDSAFVLEPDDARDGGAVEGIVRCIGGSPYFCFDPGAMPIDARNGDSALHRLIVSLKRGGNQAVFVRSAPADSFIEVVARETDSLYVDAISDYRHYMALASRAQFVISGRYHNPILAAIMGCPSIVFGSTNHKVHGACEMLDGVIGSPYDSTHLLPDLAEISQRACTYREDRTALADRLREVCSRRRLEVTRLGDLLSNVLQCRA